jgi:hypothetical protein
MGGGGGFVAAITDPISDVLGTSGGDGGLLGAVEDVGGFIGDAGEIIDNAVIQPVVDDPVNTAIKLGAYYVGGPLGSAVASAGISAAQGNDIEDIARDAAVSYVAGQVGGQVGGAVAGETGSQLAGNLAQGGTSGATSAVLSGRDPVTGLLSGVTNAGITQGVNYGVDAVGNLFTPSTVPSNIVASNTSGTTSDVGVDPTYQAWQNAINSGDIIPNRPLTQAELQAAGITTGTTGMDETFYDIFGNNADAGLAFVNPPLNLGDVEAQDGGFYGGAAPANPYENMSDTQLAAVIASRDGTDTNTALNIVKQLGTQAVKSLLGGGSRPAGQGGATGNTGLGGLLGGGVNAYLSSQQRQAIQNAYNQQAQQVAQAAARAQQQATFKPVGITTAFGQSQFQVDPATGQLVSAGYTPTAQTSQQIQNLFGLGAQALPTTADTQAIQQQYIAQQQGLLAPGREQQLAQLRNRQYQRGTGGLATGGTVAGYTPGAAGLMQTNPEMAAYYNALAREDAALSANAPTYAQNLLNAQINTGTGLFGAANTLEGYARQPLALSTDLAKAQAASGAYAGQLGLTGQRQAAQLAAEGALLGNAAMQGTYNQLGQVATGVGNTVGGLFGQIPAIQNWLA